MKTSKSGRTWCDSPSRLIVTDEPDRQSVIMGTTAGGPLSMQDEAGREVGCHNAEKLLFGAPVRLQRSLSCEWAAGNVSDGGAAVLAELETECTAVPLLGWGVAPPRVVRAGGIKPWPGCGGRVCIVLGSGLRRARHGQRWLC